MSSPPKEIGLKESSHAEPIASVLTEDAGINQMTDTKRSSAEVARSHFEIEPWAPKKPALDVTPGRVEKEQSAQAQKASQVPAKQDKSIPSFNGNHNVQTYLLVLLNIFTVIVIALLSFNLLKRRSTIDSEHLSKTLDSLKATDESIAAIDVMINRELKKLDHS